MSFLKSCTQCKFYQRGFCSYYSRNVFSTGEAQLCPAYSVIGFVQIGPINSLSGQLVEYQIPTGIITTLKLADLAVTSAKLADDAVTLIKIADDVITDAKIDPAAAILESKLSLNYPTHSNSQDHPQAHTLTSHTTRAHSELTGIGSSDHHVKTTSIGDLTDHNKANHDALALDHASLSNVLTSQHHVRYADSEAKAACVSDVAFATSWNAVADVAPSKNAVYDAIRQHLNYPQCNLWYVNNGATLGEQSGSAVLMPNADADAKMTGTIIVPDGWITGIQTYLKVMYCMSVASQAYSGLWYICAYKNGETIGAWNILSASSGYDFAQQTAINKFGINSIDCGTTIEAGDRVGFIFSSDASNGTILKVVGAWLQW